VNLGVTSDYVATGSRGTLGHWNESWPSSFSSIGVMDTCHSCWALPVEVVDEESVALHTTSATAKIWFWAWSGAQTADGPIRIADLSLRRPGSTERPPSRARV